MIDQLIPGLDRSACSRDPAVAHEQHRIAKLDASTGEPTTPRGRALLASSRPWPGMPARIGECLCGSSLMFSTMFSGGTK